MSRRKDVGLRSYLTGQAAEEQVLKLYLAQGHRLLARRWRGGGGEVDLVLQHGGCVVFVEVKASRDFTTALSHLTHRQMARIRDSAAQFLGFCAGGQRSAMRIDVAVVDDAGRIEIVPNAF